MSSSSDKGAMSSNDVTLWYSTFGTGDGHDFATRGYLSALMAVGFEGLRLPPSISTSVLRLDRTVDPEIGAFAPLLQPPPSRQLAPLKRIQAGDPRIGTKRVIKGSDEAGRPMDFEAEVTEGSVDLDADQEFAKDSNTETRCVVIHHDPASICRHYTNFIRHGKPKGVAYVGLTVWETSTIPEAVAVVLSELDLIIVPSEHSRSALIDGGVTTEVVVVPHTFDERSWPEPTGKELELRERDKFVFYMVGTPIERKNMRHLMRAYFMAFEGDDGVILRIKTSEKEPVTEMARDALEMSGIDPRKRPALRIFDGKWSIAKIREFHLDGDCFVSATHGEGFDLPALEAKLCGSRVITTDWGASREFVRLFDEDLLVPFDLENVHGMYGIGCYEPEQQWAQPRLEDLVLAMRRAAGERLAHNWDSWSVIQRRLGHHRIGEQLAGILRTVIEDAKRETDDELW